MLRPPIVDVAAGFLACWTNTRGAVLSSERTSPLGKRTRSPLTSAPASRHMRERLRVVAKIDADFLKNGLGIVLDEVQAVLGQHLVKRDLPLDVGELRALTGRRALRPAGLGAAAGSSPAP